MLDNRKTGVSATWMIWAIVSRPDRVLSMPNIKGLRLLAATLG